MPKSEQIKSYLRERVSLLSKGDRLPSESDIMRQFNVSRPTAAKCFLELSAAGIVYRMQGKGTFVLDPVAAIGMRDFSIHGWNHPMDDLLTRTLAENLETVHGLTGWTDLTHEMRGKAHFLKVIPAELHRQCEVLMPLNVYATGDRVIGRFNSYLHYFRRNGFLYGVPRISSPVVFLVNREMLRLAKIEIPVTGWSLDDFQQVVIRLRESGLVGPIIPSSFIVLLSFIWSAGGEVFDELSGECRINSLATRRAVELIKDLVELCNAGSEYTEQKCFDAFEKGEVAMIPWGGGIIGCFKAKDIDVLPLPYRTTPRTALLVEGIGIGKDCSCPLGAYRVLRDMSSLEVQLRFSDGGNLVPFLLDDESKSELSRKLCSIGKTAVFTGYIRENAAGELVESELMDLVFGSQGSPIGLRCAKIQYVAELVQKCQDGDPAIHSMATG